MRNIQVEGQKDTQIDGLTDDEEQLIKKLNLVFQF